MIKLHEMIWIKELEPHKSVEGLTREKVCPLDMLSIEGVVYRIDNMYVKSDNLTHFTASLYANQRTQSRAE